MKCSYTEMSNLSAKTAVLKWSRRFVLDPNMYHMQLIFPFILHLTVRMLRYVKREKAQSRFYHIYIFNYWSSQGLILSNRNCIIICWALNDYMPVQRRGSSRYLYWKILYTSYIQCIKWKTIIQITHTSSLDNIDFITYRPYNIHVQRVHEQRKRYLPWSFNTRSISAFSRLSETRFVYFIYSLETTHVYINL